MSSSEPRAIVVGHGDFAAGITSAVAQITGKGDQLIPMSNRGLSADAIESAIAAATDADDVLVIFTDLPAGSATVAARRVIRTRPGLTLVAGTNLAVLLDFLMSPEPDQRAAAIRAAERGRTAIAIVGGGDGR
jgi:mannose/fructose-specific phosphotransferase system component IIA